MNIVDKLTHPCLCACEMSWDGVVIWLASLCYIGYFIPLEEKGMYFYVGSLQQC